MLPAWFSHDILIPMSFEEFYWKIHQLSAEQLRAVFKSSVTFVILQKNVNFKKSE